MVTSTATYRFVKDHLGSVREVVDVATNAVVQQREYDAWGRVLVDTNPGFQAFGFSGGSFDADTGLGRFGARDLEASLGRWAARDPSRFNQADGPNLYAYVANDPVNLVDPSGRYGDTGGGSGAAADFSPPADDDQTCYDCEPSLWYDLLLAILSGPLACSTGNCNANDNLEESADSFVSRCRKGGIRREFPGELLEQTLGFIKKCSTAPCHKAWKLLNDNRWKKPEST